MGIKTKKGAHMLCLTRGSYPVGIREGSHIIVQEHIQGLGSFQQKFSSHPFLKVNVFILFDNEEKIYITKYDIINTLIQ